MSRAPARFRQADASRALRACPDGWRVRIEKSGDIVFERSVDTAIPSKLEREVKILM